MKKPINPKYQKDTSVIRAIERVAQSVGKEHLVTKAYFYYLLLKGR